MILNGEHDFTRPGQFCQISLPGFFLRRPISVCDWWEEGFSIVYKPVGRGTRDMADMQKGTTLDIITGLGNGFEDSFGLSPVLIGGGVGAAPLVALARSIRRSGRSVQVLLGFTNDAQICLDDVFENLQCTVRIATVQPGSHRTGLVTDLLDDDMSHCDYLYTCGPEIMMRAVRQRVSIPGQYSLEARMGCGFGACMGCSVHTRDGSRRVCLEGPVFTEEDLLWEQQ